MCRTNIGCHRAGKECEDDHLPAYPFCGSITIRRWVGFSVTDGEGLQGELGGPREMLGKHSVAFGGILDGWKHDRATRPEALVGK